MCLQCAKNNGSLNQLPTIKRIQGILAQFQSNINAPKNGFCLKKCLSILAAWMKDIQGRPLSTDQSIG